MTRNGETQDKIRTAVVTGRHPYDVVNFQQAFRSILDLDLFPQHLEDFGTDTGTGRSQYDVVVFYNMHMSIPGADNDKLGLRVRTALEQLGESDQGILVLHHGILAFPDWQLWSDLCGIQDRRFDSVGGQAVRVAPVNPQHPITSGMSPWDLEDETYIMADAGEGCDVLLTTSHPKSMRTLAWSRTYKSARVVCYQSGHDNYTFANPQFRAFLARSILWLAGRI